jgi:hypothetical protein
MKKHKQINAGMSSATLADQFYGQVIVDIYWYLGVRLRPDYNRTTYGCLQDQLYDHLKELTVEEV